MRLLGIVVGVGAGLLIIFLCMILARRRRQHSQITTQNITGWFRRRGGPPGAGRK